MEAGGALTKCSALIVGLSGCELLAEEALFLNAHRPCGLIIFSRNYSSDLQLRQLIEGARVACGHADWLVLVDQEGGRVQRLRGGTWPDFPSAAAFGSFYQDEAEAGVAAARLSSHWLGTKLRDVGINTNCAPCLDIPVPGADGVIGDRAYGNEPTIVSALGGAVVDGLIAGGVVPVIKHIPGHGRAGLDSHLALPVVDAPLPELAGSDFAPFTILNHAPAAMSAHVTFSAIDPAAPASISRGVTEKIIRQKIGFDGLLMSDDISMKALAGTIGERCKAVLTAGSDVVLHCNGVMSEMCEAAAVVPELSGVSRQRYIACLDITRRRPEPIDATAAQQALEKVRIKHEKPSDNAAAQGLGLA